MPHPIKVLDIELSQPLLTINGLDGYATVQALVRLHGVPIGFVNAPIAQGRCSAHTLSRLILDRHHDAIARQLLRNGLMAGLPPQVLKLETLLELLPPDRTDWPLVTVAVCCHAPSADLALCLNAIAQLDYPNLDLLVVDCTSTEPISHLSKQYPTVRYIQQPDSNWGEARDRALIEAKGDIVAFVDAEVQIDRGWVKAIAQVFADNPTVLAVTGLVIPTELETEAQLLSEQCCFEQDFEQRWFTDRNQLLRQPFITGQAGAIANIAYRRSLFAKISGFAGAIGGDLEIMRRILRQGDACVYEPRAIGRQRPPRNHAQLRDRIFEQSQQVALGIDANSADQRRSLSLVAIIGWNFWRLVRSWIHPTFFPRDLIWAELSGSLSGLMHMRQPDSAIRQPLLDRFPGDLPAPASGKVIPTRKIAVRQVELSQPLTPLSDLSDYEAVQMYFTWQQTPIAQALRPTRPLLTLDRLQAAVVEAVGLRLLDLDRTDSDAVLAARVLAMLRERWNAPIEPVRLPVEISVSIIVGTCDRPDALRQCLTSLTAQQTDRSIDIIVVDNRPESGLTPPIVAEFPSVQLCCEPRAGVAYARNAGITHSRGEIIVTVDDDVVVPSDWLEKLIAPLTCADVLAVTGNILPLELDTPAQCLFEQYGNGGLGRGFERFEANRDWFMRSLPFAVPTWELGATANSAFRALIFHDPAIGLMDEALGPGMPSGVGEDIYLFYKILKAGGTLIYEPSAFVWHQHRRDRSALARQIFGYSKGIVAYHLTTLFNDGDWRAFLSLVIGLPLYYTKRIVLRLLGRTAYPLSLLTTEMRGNLSGPWALWKSHQRVREQGRSTPYLPPSQRSTPASTSILSSR